MNERAYKAMSFAGAVNIAVGIVIAVVGVAAGVLAIISGARLLREKKGLLSKKSGLKGCLIFEFKEQKKNPYSRKDIVRTVYYIYYLLSDIFRLVRTHGRDAGVPL